MIFRRIPFLVHELFENISFLADYEKKLFMEQDLTSSQIFDVQNYFDQTPVIIWTTCVLIMFIILSYVIVMSMKKNEIEILADLALYILWPKY